MDLNTLKAKIEALPVMGNCGTIYVARHHVLALITTHAAETAPVAVEGLQGPPVEWVKNHPETAAKLIKDQANRIHGFAPTDNTALVEALRWYEEQVRNCRKITPDGEAARQQLDRDGGKRAVAALSQPAAPQPTVNAEICRKCMGTGTAGHPDSGYTCDCNGGMVTAPIGYMDVEGLKALVAEVEARPAAPQPTPEVEEVSVAAKVIVDAWDADTLPVCDPDPMMPAFIAALRALARGSVAEKGKR